MEVKAANANDADRERGIYQCVKYQAVLRAELKAEGKIPNGSSLLITETQLSPTLQALANLLGIRVVVVPAKGPQRPSKNRVTGQPQPAGGIIGVMRSLRSNPHGLEPLHDPVARFENRR